MYIRVTIYTKYVVPKLVHPGAELPHCCSTECSILLFFFFPFLFSLCILVLSLFPYLTSYFLNIFFLLFFKMCINILLMMKLLIYLKAFVQLKHPSVLLGHWQTAMHLKHYVVLGKMLLNSTKKETFVWNSVSNWYVLLNYRKLLCGFIKQYKERLLVIKWASGKELSIKHHVWEGQFEKYMHTEFHGIEA